MAAEFKFDDKVYDEVNKRLGEDLTQRGITLYTIQSGGCENPYPIKITTLYSLRNNKCKYYSLSLMLDFFGVKHGVYCELD